MVKHLPEQKTQDMRVAARVPEPLVPMYQALLQNGYKPSEIARAGIRTLYRELKQEATA